MTRMTGPDCAVMCSLMSTHTRTHTHILNTHTHTHTHTHTLIPPREDQCEWHRMTRMTGPDCVVMCNLINTHTHTHTHTETGARTVVAEMGTGTTITGTRIGLGRAGGRLKSARNRKKVVDAVRETGETRVESEQNVEKKGLV